VIQCPDCSAEVPEGGRFCGSCGASVGEASEAPTRTSAPSALPTELATPVSSPATSSSVDQGRFLPGTVLAKRYRIIGLLGRGGMGEVYRADDLKLGQPVALKFLPRDVERDEGRLQRFLNEVRMALKVTHPNVTRVHDIGEVDGHHYISMEYVDGEDLSSLLRRIGRLPKDKAVQVARQICAGLAAAHDQGVLHRDLKPANVMLDGRGQVKITDFGLAGLDETIKGAEAQAGTPAYMAPEQWAGQEVTAQSDLYALGLVLYELFTGESVFSGKTPAEILKIQQEGSSSVTSPSTVIEGMDPSVERVILKCLEKAPGGRPQSALAVAAALPGGDPLAAALAAGETPSPELVAQAGGSEGLSAKVSLVLLVAIVIGLVGAAYLSDKTLLPNRAALPNPPQYLKVKAQEILGTLGFDQSPTDSLFWFERNESYISYVGRQPPETARWQAFELIQPSALWFFYRQSPEPLVKNYAATIGAWGEDPAPLLPGMAELALDSNGRLLALQLVPPESGPFGVPDEEPDWNQLLVVAGFDPVDLLPVEPGMNPPVFADSRRAWSGAYPDHPDTEVRLEAAGLGSLIVSFRILEPWTPLSTLDVPETERAAPIVLWLMNLWIVVVVVAGILIAWRNLRLGRGDRRTATYLGFYTVICRLLWLIVSHHPGGGGEVALALGHLGRAVYYGFLVVVWYLALEPYARKIWPGILVTWVRAWRGNLRDPLVGRDLLVGVCAGVLVTNASVLQIAITEARGLAGPSPGMIMGVFALEPLRGVREAFGALAGVHLNTLFGQFMMLLMLLILRLVFRRTWAAVLGLLVLWGVMTYPASGGVWSHLGLLVITAPILLGCLFRFGLLAVFTALATGDLLLPGIPVTLELSAWYSAGSLFALAVILGIAGWAFYISLAGRPLFRDDLLSGAAADT